MDETLGKADLENLRTALQEDLRGTEQRLEAKIDEGDQRLGAKIDKVDRRLGARIDEVDQRLGAKIDEVDQRLGAKIDEVDQRLDAKMDSGFALVGRLMAESEDRLLRHMDIRFESVEENIRKLADGVLANNEQLARHMQQSDAEHRRLEAMTLGGDAALDKRITALEVGGRRG
jgi:tetrahydromethanopterin S-methyltransferase subunit G